MLPLGGFVFANPSVLRTAHVLGLVTGWIVGWLAGGLVASRVTDG
ncbi:MAG: hypothetical protein ACREC6_14700 [Hyphomicrobiaceae bacterium]